MKPLLLAKKISKQKGYDKLAILIQNEITLIEKSTNDWIEISSSTLLSRLSKVNIEGLLISLRHDRIEMYADSSKVKIPKK